MDNYSTREQILEDFITDENSKITSPGKFEGEMIYAPMFYYAILDGCGEEMGDFKIRFEIEKNDYYEFPELVGFRYVTVTEDDNGFFYCNPHN